uniref:BAH domain-containing protein n=1 Tax=Mesocestoides corti TaxID=53468 RepID=A0A5K3EKJ6_MESCO
MLSVSSRTERYHQPDRNSRGSSQFHQHSDSIDSLRATVDEPAPTLRLHEPLNVHVNSPSEDGTDFGGLTGLHSNKTTASVSPSTSSLATIDTSVSPHHRQQRQPHQRQRQNSSNHLIVPPVWHSAGIDEEDAEGDELQRPPTPDLRRIDLDLTDLSDGLRILIVEDTHLRAGTLYFEDTSLPYSSKLNSCEISRTRGCLIRLDQMEKVESPPTPTSLPRLNPNFLASSGKRRRLGEIRLEAWQVIQQAVLEVVPASPRQLPPGTRVCAAWSSTLANNLYPGFISEANANRPPLAKGCLPIDFDDGDHAEVPLHRIRMLPDHFANLTELVGATTANSNPGVKPATSPTIFGVAQQVHSSPVYPASIKVKRRESTSKRLHLANGGGSTSTEPSPPIRENDWLGDWQERKESIQNVKEPLEIIWKPRGKLRRKHNGMPCYKSLKRNKDGLIVTLGDVVKFNSGGNGQAYLGEVKLICVPRHGELSPLVYASWFYCPQEAGEDGKRVAGCEGAVFLTDHVDDNEANCIIGRVQIARNYSEFRLARQRINESSSLKDENKECHASDRQVLLPDDDLTSLSGSSGNDSGSDEALPAYFVAGKFDPLARRVITWDPDLSAELHLKTPPASPDVQ